MPPPAERRRRLQDGIWQIQNVAAVEIVFRGAPGCFHGTWIYIGGRSRSVEPRGAHEGEGAPRGVGAPPPSWAPRASTDLLLPPIYTHVPRKHPGAPRKTISTVTTFCIREIPSWSLRRCSAEGGIDHGGPLHQQIGRASCRERV